MPKTIAGKRAREDWTYTNLPKEIMDEIDALIKSKTSGYTNRREFLADAARRRLEELKKLR